MKVQGIGNLKDVPSGQDSFALVTLEEADLEAAVKDSLTAQAWVERELLKSVQQIFATGLQFCDSVTVLPYPARGNSFIVVAHVRQDI